VANDNLRQALQDAGLVPDDLAQIVQVDVRTVRRWLSGSTPYPRQRGKVARALDLTEHDLWPEAAVTPTSPTRAGQPTDLIAGYPTASDPAAPDCKALMRDATSRIELLGDTLTPVLATPGVPELLAAQAAHGCEIRILLAYPGPHLVPLINQAGIEIRVLEGPAHQTTYRFDDQLLLILHLHDRDADQAPLLHLQRAAPAGLFDRLADDYQYLWEDDSQPIDPDVDLAVNHEDEDEIPESDPPLPAAHEPETPHAAPSTPAPRRWPRRPN
jgi:hypothetical protein